MRYKFIGIFVLLHTFVMQTITTLISTTSKTPAVLMNESITVSFKTFFIMLINPRIAIAVIRKIKMNRKLK